MVGRGVLSCSVFQGGGGRRAGHRLEGGKGGRQGGVFQPGLSSSGSLQQPLCLLASFSPLSALLMLPCKGMRRLAMGSPGLRPMLLLPQVLLLLLLRVPQSWGFPGRS